jgi:hypothetical protein
MLAQAAARCDVIGYKINLARFILNYSEKSKKIRVIQLGEDLDLLF